MALDFTPANSRVDCGSDASLDNLNPATWWGWFFLPSSVSGDAFLFAKSGFTPKRLLSFHDATRPASVDLTVARATVHLQSIVHTADDAILQRDKWLFAAARYDTAGVDADQQMFLGDLSTTAREALGYNTQTVGSGAVTDDSADSLFIGGSSSGGGSNSIVAYAGIVDRYLSLSEIRRLQWSPRPIRDSVLFVPVGFNGTGTQHDLSGNGNDGTVTNATVSDHVPILPGYASRRSVLVPVTVAAAISNARMADMAFCRGTVPFGVGRLPIPDGTID